MFTVFATTNVSNTPTEMERYYVKGRERETWPRYLLREPQLL